jgi:hypothetical protein
MDVDVPNITTPFKKLTDEERAKYRARRKCFRCRTQGHMACNCPKNANAQNITNCQNANTQTASMTTNIPAPLSSAPSVPPSAPNVTPPPLPKLLHAQQICAIEEQMEDEERSNYLDARDMGEDFCTAGL